MNAIAPRRVDLVAFCEAHRSRVLARLSQAARAIVDATSFETFVLLADRFGGTEVYIAEAWAPDTKLGAVIGEAALMRLREALGAGALAVPTLSAVRTLYRDHWMRALSSQGHSRRAIAAAFGVHTRTVGRCRQGGVHA